MDCHKIVYHQEWAFSYSNRYRILSSLHERENGVFFHQTKMSRSRELCECHRFCRYQQLTLKYCCGIRGWNPSVLEARQDIWIFFINFEECDHKTQQTISILSSLFQSIPSILSHQWEPTILCFFRLLAQLSPNNDDSNCFWPFLCSILALCSALPVIGVLHQF